MVLFYFLNRKIYTFIEYILIKQFKFYVLGDCNISELLSSLINAQEMFTIQQQIEIREEGERNSREMIKVEQDEAYQQSLAIDRYIFNNQ